MSVREVSAGPAAGATREPEPRRLSEPDPLSPRQRRDQARGYSVKYLYVAIAYLGEVVLIAASLVGAWLFAQKYGDGTNETLIMMLLAPVSYAVVEMCRVPMAIAFRTQTNMLLKSVLFVGLVCAAGVTVKSLSQLGEQMFHPRLIRVANAEEDLNAAMRDQKIAADRIAAADAVVAKRTTELNTLDARRTQLETTRQGIPAPKCQIGFSTNREGRRYATRVCDKDDPRLPLVEADLRRTMEEWGAARQKLDQAIAERAAFSRDAADKVVGERTTVYRDAVRDSQLHSFAAMVFRKSPSEVTSGEIHAFLFFFVFFPAIFASVAATLLALGAVTRLPKSSSLALPAQAGAYVLGPLAEHIIRQTTESVHKSAQAEVAEAASRAAGARIKAVT